MSISDLHIIATVGAFIAFISIAWWAYSPSNKKRFEEDAQLALDDDMLGSSASNSRNKDKR
ncbi:MAG TPA: cbb3-type cytochrome c oxidase subunit 3 [Psychrobacter sp.]|uniref:Cbb3-type cytochrome oxidase component FixQ n=1 Tax=Psychrobacter pasteurii TaxID=1945520 RepID=A0A1R4EDK8_9GAMM|nr:cbb3-type cytochrome c oxidase subunit 3 [Psychrobacter pasteurii]SJM36572.1 Cbb3-type cytochrome oxidase component FixQ [Psychrobacter pasteurii]HAO60330.1 cbb3-type cytochrome c oxidase subunit 3 [Psychrobacter sp.]HJH09518.1 cbb3-type cytochrome c oxidase subunit 3 [Psychrobacter pasteurii]